MKKQITIHVCDICKENEEDTNEDLRICEICGKEVCHECLTEFELLNDDKMGFPMMDICVECLDDEKAENELKRFFKQKEVIAQFKNMRSQLKEYLVKIAMLNSLKSKENPSTDRSARWIKKYDKEFEELLVIKCKLEGVDLQVKDELKFLEELFETTEDEYTDKLIIERINYLKEQHGKFQKSR